MVCSESGPCCREPKTSSPAIGPLREADNAIVDVAPNISVAEGPRKSVTLSPVNRDGLLLNIETEADRLTQILEVEHAPPLGHAGEYLSLVTARHTPRCAYGAMTTTR